MAFFTDKEARFLKTFFIENGCGAETPNELLSDNFSCQNVEDFCESNPEYTPQSFGGLISSLENKGVITIEDDRGVDYPSRKPLPALYWLSDCFLEAMATQGLGDTSFKELDLLMMGEF